MVKNDDKKGGGFAVSSCKGAGLGLGVILMLFALAAALITGGRLPEESVKAVVWTAGFFGALSGSYFAIKLRGSQALAVGGSVGGVLFVLTLIGSVFSDSEGLLGTAAPGLIAALFLGSLCGSLLSTVKRKRRR